MISALTAFLKGVFIESGVEVKLNMHGVQGCRNEAYSLIIPGPS